MRGTKLGHGLAAAIGLAVGAVSMLVRAGPLNPPAGPVASTFKTIGEVEPRTAINAANTPGDVDCTFKIAAPGSYYLTGNVTGATGKHGIKIVAADVHLDLMGFTMTGAAGSLDGINSGGSRVTIRNGSITSWGGRGILCNGTTQGGQITDVRASFNGQGGVLTGRTALIRDCTVESNNGNGIATNLACIVEGCTAANNVGNGINAVSSSVVACAAIGNGGDGISAGNGSTVSECSSVQNAGAGFAGVGDTRFTDCTARGNDADGFDVALFCAVTSCTADLNGVGALGGAGIHAASDGNRIEGNLVANNDRGIDVDNGGNLIIRNSARENGGSGGPTNYVIAVGNSFAPAANVTGSSNWGSITNANHPWANLGF